MDDYSNYFLPEIGTTENIISIKLLHYLQKIDINEFVKKYQISNFWQGKYFIKRLIKKVFKYKLYINLKWYRAFWNDIQIQLIDSQITPNKNITLNNLLSKYSTKRQNDIIKYKSMIEKKIDLGNPLFITGDCLNLIGGNVSSNAIYMLDGSRRLVASLLSNKFKIPIWLITLKV